MPAAKLNASRAKSTARPSGLIPACGILPETEPGGASGTSEANGGSVLEPLPGERDLEARAQPAGSYREEVRQGGASPPCRRSIYQLAGSYPGSPGPGILPDTCSAVSAH